MSGFKEHGRFGLHDIVQCKDLHPAAPAAAQQQQRQSIHGARGTEPHWGLRQNAHTVWYCLVVLYSTVQYSAVLYGAGFGG